jgi:SPW repeat
MTARDLSIEGHPDLRELRARYEVASETVTARALAGLTLLSGLYIAVSPWVVGFADTTPVAVSDLIGGLALALLALGFGSVYGRTHNVVWTAPVIGIWVLVSPWSTTGVDVGAGLVLSNVIAGGLAALFSAGLLVRGAMSNPGRRSR